MLEKALRRNVIIVVGDVSPRDKHINKSNGKLEATILGTMDTLVAGFTPLNYHKKIVSTIASSHGQLFRPF